MVSDPSALPTALSEISQPVTFIRPAKGWIGINVRELWQYRELTYFFIWRDVKVRYKQTLLGAGWAILRPFITMIIFSIIFGRLAGLPTDDIPGPVFYYAGLLPWVLFQDGVSKSGNSLVGGRNLITKVYFPRLAIPISAVTAGLVDFAISFVVLLGLMLFFQVPLAPSVWLLPFFLVLALLSSLGAGSYLGALNVKYRDVAQVIPFLLQAWMYASPVAYSATIIPEGIWQFLYGLNPMASAVQGFRWAMLGSGKPSIEMLTASIISCVLLVLVGVYYFRRTEKTFADLV